jgi:hypothetical protein
MKGDFPVNLWVAGQSIDTKNRMGQESENVKEQDLPGFA